jgi:hypothetical protein
MKYQLEEKLPSCHVKKEMLIKLEEYFLNKSPEILENSEARVCSCARIKEEMGTLELNSISEYQHEKFSPSTKMIRLQNNSFGSASHTIDVYFYKGGSATCDISITGENPKEKAIAIFNGVKEIVDQYKTYHGLLHSRYLSWSYVLPGAFFAMYLYDKKFITIGWAIGVYFVLSILSQLVIYYVYPKVDIESSAVISPKKIFHYILTVVVIGIFVAGFIQSHLFK